DIMVESLRKLYNKTRAENWGFYNQQDLKVVPFAYEGAGDFSRGAVALSPYASLAEYELSFVPVLRHESGRNLPWHFIVEAPARSGQWGGISYIIINTFVLILFTILFSTPLGVMAAIYMVEYAKQGRVLRLLRMGSDTLAGIPSIVFGLFGFIFFVRILGMGIGFISSTLTVTLMVLPTIIRTTEEALKSVPPSLREGSLALGATKLQTIAKVVLPAASPGILTGIILAVGRTVGETAVLIYTLGSNYDLVSGPSSSARVLSLHLYMLFSEAVSFDRTFATAAVLVIIILMTNLTTTRVLKQFNKNSGM
uniref:phosphate ABC transporter permease PstA n=1 Tax=Oceanispirochaeta sp. TaxID=2035350 RepID=UPI0026379C6B